VGLLRSLFKNLGTAEEPPKPAPWLVAVAGSLGTVARPPEHAAEEGVIDGTTADGLAWTLRFLTRIEADADSPREHHHILWHGSGVDVDDVVLVFGSSSHDARLWAGLDGITVHPDAIDNQMTSAFDALEQLVHRVEAGALSERGFMDELSRTNRGGPMVSFVEKAAPFALPHPLSAPWHALTVDPVVAARVLTPAVIVAIEEWRAKAPTYDSWIRAWVGGPNVRLECWLVAPDPATYRRVIDLGVSLTRATREAITRKVPYPSAQ
jgi:hypothetical protein